jgi:hypothetical protein
LAEQALSAERARADELQEELTGYKETHVHIVRDRKRLESTCVYLTSTLARVDTERLAQRAQLDDAHNALTAAGVPLEPHEPHEGCQTQLGHRVRLLAAREGGR